MRGYQKDPGRKIRRRKCQADAAELAGIVSRAVAANPSAVKGNIYQTKDGRAGNRIISTGRRPFRPDRYRYLSL